MKHHLYLQYFYTYCHCNNISIIRSEGIAFWCFVNWKHIELNGSLMFIDFSVVTAMSCMSCFECTTGETASSWRLLDSGQVRIKVESIVLQSRGAFLNFVFLSIDALVYDVFSTPFWKFQMLCCHQKPDKMGFQPYWISTKVFRDIWKSNDFGHHFNHFHPRHVQAENLAHQHFNDLFKQYPSSFIQVH